MLRNLPTKSSSRAGRFKKKLVTQETLVREAPLISEKVGPILELYHQGVISAPIFTSLYLLVILSIRSPKNWLGALREKSLSGQMDFPLSGLGLQFEENIQKRLLGLTNLGEIFSRFALKSTPESVNRALLSWAKGEYGLELMFRIPTPAEVLKQQKEARRCVTVITDQLKLSSYILGERDCLSFTMHDLIHADHFYRDNECFKGQLGVYGLLDHCLKEGHFDKHLESEKFQAEFEYLIADMNAYAIHLLKCLKSALIFYGVHEFFEDWAKKISRSDAEFCSLLALNTMEFSEHDDITLLALLERYRP